LILADRNTLRGEAESHSPCKSVKSQIPITETAA
jgi:hypothetical protein